MGERGMLRGVMLKSEAEDNPVQLYPAAMLDLLWTILAEDVALWPYKVEDLLNPLFETPATRADPRLSELRRRRRIYRAPTLISRVGRRTVAVPLQLLMPSCFWPHPSISTNASPPSLRLETTVPCIFLITPTTT